MSTAVPEMVFSSLTALRAEHRELQKIYRDQEITPTITLRIEDFIRRGRATGAILDDDEDQAAAQALLDFWGTSLYRGNYSVPDTTLAPFDPTAAPTLDDDLVPYVGLGWFAEGNKDLFFGREDLIAFLVDRLARQNLLAISGPSGGGKSSLVLAGIIPALKNGALPSSKDWRYLGRMVPGSSPFENLARLLLRAQENGSGRTQALAEELKSAPERLHEIAASGSSGTAVLVIDQFEELSTLCEDPSVREAFEKALVSFVRDGGTSRHILVLTMRSDFIGAVARQPELQNLLETGLVPITPLSAAELREAITRPAERVGLKFEAGIVESLVHDILGEPAALPLLQFTLLKLWERRDHNRITMEAFRELGGGRLALTRCADKFINSLIPQERILAERILLRLVRPGIGQDTVANRVRKVSLYSIGPRENVDRVLDKLVQEHLVRLTEGEVEADSEVEIAHEALVRNWQHLVSLLDAERERMTTLRRLELKAGEWVRLGRGTAGLLRDVALVEAEQWLASPDFEALGASDDLRSLVSASRKAANTARKRESRAKFALAGLALVAVIFALGAFKYARKANEEKKLANINWNKAEEGRREADRQRQEADRQRTRAEDLNTELDGVNENLKHALAKSEGKERVSEAHELAADDVRKYLEQDPARASLLALEAAVYLVAHKKEVAADPHGQHVSGDVQRALSDAMRTNPVRVLLPAAGSEVSSLAFRPDGLRVAATDARKHLRIWNAITGEELPTVQAASGATAVAFSGNNHLAVAIKGEIRIFDANSGRPSRTLFPSASDIKHLIFSPGGQYLAAVGSGGAEIWLEQTVIGKPKAEATAIAFNPTGDLIALGSNDGSVKILDLDSFNLLQSAQLSGGGEHSSVIRDVSFSADGKTLAIAIDDHPVRLWSLTSHYPPRTISGFNAPAQGVSYSADGYSLIIVGKDEVANCNSQGSTCQRVAVKGISAFAVNLDGSRVVAAPKEGSVRVWDVLPSTSQASVVLSTPNSTGKPTTTDPFASLADAIAKAVGTLTEDFADPNDCSDTKDICRGLRAAVTDVVEGNKLAKLGATGQATSKFRDAMRKCPWLGITDKQVELIQAQASDETARQRTRGQIAIARILARAGVDQDSISATLQAAKLNPETLRNGAVQSTASLFRSAAQAAAIREEEQLARLWLNRARKMGLSTEESEAAEFKELMTSAYVQAAENDVQTRAIQKAIEHLQKARVYSPTLASDNDRTFNDNLCWRGSIGDLQLAKDAEIIAACDRLVALSDGDTGFRDSRGVNRARNGKYRQAIEDFQSLLDDANRLKRTANPEEIRKTRERWISILKEDHDPFTVEELRPMQRGW